jgi:hypothetical protein
LFIVSDDPSSDFSIVGIKLSWHHFEYKSDILQKKTGVWESHPTPPLVGITQQFLATTPSAGHGTSRFLDATIITSGGNGNVSLEARLTHYNAPTISAALTVAAIVHNLDRLNNRSGCRSRNKNALSLTSISNGDHPHRNNRKNKHLHF